LAKIQRTLDSAAKKFLIFPVRQAKKRHKLAQNRIALA
jgi:hypothetical protein